MDNIERYKKEVGDKIDVVNAFCDKAKARAMSDAQSGPAITVFLLSAIDARLGLIAAQNDEMIRLWSGKAER